MSRRNRIHQPLGIDMNSHCPVRIAEVNYDRATEALTASLANKSEIRMEVINTADRLIRGEQVSVYRYGEKYTKELAMIDFMEHPLHDNAVFKAWNGDRMPLTDLLTRIVQRQIAVAWYGESDADSLGFSA